MTQILKTDIIPTEYDENTKESALELKHLFFKTVLSIKN